ncbi:MAG: type II secretion system protein GspL [Pseudomonadota bacterium]
MTRRLFGFLPEEGDTEVRLVRLTSSGCADVSRARDNDDVVLFVPGTDVSIFQRSLPTKGDRQSRQAAPFAIEDDVGSAIDDLHIALGVEPKDLSQPRDLHVVDRSRMEDWRERLADQGLAGAALVAEHSVLVEGDVLDIGPRVIGLLPSGPFAFDTDLPGDILTALLNDAGAQAIQVTDPLLALAERYDTHPEKALDLCQGLYGKQGGFNFANWQEWRIAAALVVFCGMALLASGYADIAATRSATSDIRNGISASYRQAFPDAPPPADPVRAISRALGDGNSGPAMDFLDTSAVLYAALAEVPDASLRAVRYDPRRGGYVASVAYLGYGDDAALQNAIEEHGYTAILGDARRGGDFVFGDVTLTQGQSR